MDLQIALFAILVVVTSVCYFDLLKQYNSRQVPGDRLSQWLPHWFEIVPLHRREFPRSRLRFVYVTSYAITAAYFVLFFLIAPLTR